MGAKPLPRAGGTAAWAQRLRLPGAPGLRRLLGARIDWRGDAVGVALAFMALSALRLASSLVLTRLLYPEAFGILAVLASALFVMEMLSDVGAAGLVVRHERAEQPRFLDTVWTVRLLRSLLNGALLFAFAPWVARLYGDDALAEPLRWLGPWFVLAGLESMAFVLAVRQQRSRLVAQAELGSQAVATLFVIAWSLASRDHWGMVYGMLVQRALFSAASHVWGPRHRPRLALDRDALREVWGFARFVMPTSLLTMLLGQYDKFVFLRLFDLQTLGVYGVAGSVALTIGSLVARITHSVIYPRCAQVHREAPRALRERFYTDNARLLVLLVALPAAVGGAAPQIVELLFDRRYAAAGLVLQLYMLRFTLQGVLAPAETLLTAVGYVKAQLVANTLRLAWLVPGSLLGWYFGGFIGFVAVSMLDVLPAAVYALATQRRKGLLVARYEVWRAALALLVWLAAAAIATLVGSTAFWAAYLQ